MRPYFSVVMPTYNSMERIANAIHSIITQTFNHWELIIVDDGSEDRTESIVNPFIKIHNNIKYFRTPHKGVVHARNFGNKKAKGDIIVIQDADDFSMPDRLEKIFRIFTFPDSKQRVDIVYHGIYINAWSELFNCTARIYMEPKPLEEEKLLREQYLPGVPAFRKEVWSAKPFREEARWAYDWMMYLDWYFSKFNFLGINEGLYDYVRHTNSSSARFEREGKRQLAFEKIKQIVKKEYGKEIEL